MSADEGTAQEVEYIDSDSLKTIGLVLEGMKLGRGGNIHPMGTYDLEQVWKILKFLRGDARYRLKGYQLNEYEADDKVEMV